MVREWKISLEWMLEGGNYSQSLCQHHLFSMGHCEEVVLSRRGVSPFPLDPCQGSQGKSCPRTLGSLFLCQGAYTTAGMLTASQGISCWVSQALLEVSSRLNPMSILGILPIEGS